MTSQDSSRMNDATTIHVTIHVTVVIQQHWNSAPGSDDAAPTADVCAEPRTRQQHAVTDLADASAADG